jgi:hypothetical protein
MKFILSFALLLVSSCGLTSVATKTSSKSGVEILSNKAIKGEVFDYYQDKSKAKWKNNWTSNLDLTGVSWNDTRTATLISPIHVVMAAHYIRPSSVPVVFHDRKGNFHERFIVGVKSLGNDVAVGKLNRPLPEGVKHYEFAKNPTAGKDVFISDQTKTISVHQIAAVKGGMITFRYHPELPAIYRRNLVSGDSGNPSFLLENGKTYLLETHTNGGPGNGPNYADNGVQAEVCNAMNELGN